MNEKEDKQDYHKEDDDEMAVLERKNYQGNVQKTNKKMSMKDIFEKAVAQNDEALRKLSKN